jgi:hypothetical protein
VILSRNIPLTTPTFIRRCTDDLLNSRYAPTRNGHRDYLIAETRRRNPKLLSYLRIPDSENKTVQYAADVDHIIPQAVWDILMFAFLPPSNPNASSFNVLSNLFWRDISWNRGLDAQCIHQIETEARTIQLNSRAGHEWRTRWIEIFLTTKHDEGLLFPGEILDPFSFDDMLSPDGSNWLNQEHK